MLWKLLQLQQKVRGNSRYRMRVTCISITYMVEKTGNWFWVF